MAKREITIENIGPIERLTINVPEEGGLCVLRARNGRGKSKALDAIENALGGTGKLEVRDGEAKGSVDAFGVTLTVGRSTRRKGELEVERLSGKYNIEMLVDPGIKNPEAADAARIKALIQIAGIEPDPSRFYALVGGQKQFEAVVGPAALASGDPVTMAEKIKRDLEQAARKQEEQAVHNEGRSLGYKKSAEGIDINAPSDALELQEALETAIRRQSELQATARAASEWQAAVVTARERLAESQQSFSGLTVEEALEDVAEAKQTLGEADDAVFAAREALKVAEDHQAEMKGELRHAQEMLKQAQSHSETIAKWRRQCEELPPAYSPADEVLLEAKQAVEDARQAIEQGALVRRAKRDIEAAKEALHEASEHRKQADGLREAAKGTDDVLSSLVAEAGLPLFVKGGRLMLQTKRGATFFADLSAGERRKLAIDGAIRKIGQRGVLVISQEGYEGLDPIARRELSEHLKLRGVVAITAECDESEEVTAEVFGE